MMDFNTLERLIEAATIEKIMEYEETLPYSFPKFEIKHKKSADDNDDKLEAILYFEEADTYVKFTGQYSSYGSGNNWYNTIEKVYPKTEYTTVYSNKNY